MHTKKHNTLQHAAWAEGDGMTTEEFEEEIAILTHPETGAEHCKEWVERLRAHDKEQRAEIEQLKAELRGWINRAAGMPGSGGI